MRTILIWYQNGGPFMVPLLLVGAAGLLLLVERVAHIVTRSRISARPFMEHVITLVRKNDTEQALKVCTEHSAALADLGLVLLRSRSTNEADLLTVAHASVLTIRPSLERRLRWLPALALLSVLLGLVGGIANLHEALLAAPGASADLGSGLAYALRPVGAGILGAIPLVAGHAWLREAALSIVALLEEFSVRLTNALMARPDVRLGHRS